MPQSSTTTRFGTDLVQLQERVLAACMGDGVFNPELIQSAVAWYFGGLGMHDYYFDSTEESVIASHIQSLEAAKLLARSSGQDIDVRLAQETEESAFFAAQSGVRRGAEDSGRVRHTSPVTQIELMIEARFLTGGTQCIGDGTALRAGSGSDPHTLPCEARSWRLQCFRSQGTLSEDSPVPMRMYFLSKPQYGNASPAEGETALEQIADADFLTRASDHLKGIFSEVVSEVLTRETPVIKTEIWTETDGVEEARLCIGFRQGSTHTFFAGCADVYRAHGFFSPRKYVEPMSNGTVVVVFYLRQLQKTSSAKFAAALARVVSDASLCYVLPRTSLSPMLRDGEVSVPESSYAYAAWKFSFHFLQRYPEGYEEVAASLKRTDAAALGRLTQLKDSMKSQLFTEGQLLDVLLTSPALVKILYADFAARHSTSADGGQGQPDDEETARVIKRACSSEEQLQVFLAFLAFNKHVVRTNFFQPAKVALSFRLDPGFLSSIEYPLRPYAVVFVIGSEFRGFHVRFEDVARGGVRMIRSAYPQVYTRNVTTVFDECYMLASTQQRKNKDIPEGGSKGTILLNLQHQDKATVAFKKYVDSFIDLLLPDTAHTVDHLGKEELVFLGPDEGTADLMDWASAHARSRGYRYWKAFTTGKSPSLGGIPHDTYGMTTHSVRQYVLGIQSKLGLDASACLKMQTGGPDGDLGSNEILMSKERTVAIVDGSGVLCDPEGLDQAELERLARARQMVSHVDPSKLSPRAYLVLVDQTGVTLPDGTVVDSGMQFRNLFHLNAAVSGDFFVPCGGRPAAVNLENVQQFLRHPDTGALRFKYIVEGANLFFTPEARNEVENAGVILFKDASANKGGVTSSSLEVLAALVLSDDEFAEHMAVAEGQAPPAFYAAYVREVQGIIDENARLEFECLWREHERVGGMRHVLTDQLSSKIVELRSAVTGSNLWDNQALRLQVLEMAVPQALRDLIGLPQILERLPETYTRALFASQLASRFVYHTGLATPEFAFYEFVNTFVGGSSS